MSFLFSFFVLPFVLVGMVLCAKNIYFYLLKHPKLGQSAPNKAGLVTFVFTGVSAGLIAAPHFLTGAFGVFNYVLAAVYLTYIVVGLTHSWKWIRLIWAVEDNDPTNDPKLPGDEAKDGTAGNGKVDCGCPGGKTGVPAATTPKPGADTK